MEISVLLRRAAKCSGMDISICVTVAIFLLLCLDGRFPLSAKRKA